MFQNILKTITNLFAPKPSPYTVNVPKNTPLNAPSNYASTVNRNSQQGYVNTNVNANRLSNAGASTGNSRNLQQATGLQSMQIAAPQGAGSSGSDGGSNPRPSLEQLGISRSISSVFSPRSTSSSSSYQDQLKGILGNYGNQGPFSGRTQVAQSAPSKNLAELVKRGIGSTIEMGGYLSDKGYLGNYMKSLSRGIPELNIGESLIGKAQASGGNPTSGSRGLGAVSTPANMQGRTYVKDGVLYDSNGKPIASSSGNLDNSGLMEDQKNWQTGAEGIIAGGNQNVLGDMYSDVDGYYGLLNEDLQNMVVNPYEQGALSPEEAQRRAADLKRRATEQTYDRLIGQQKDLIPQYENLFTTEQAEIERQRKLAKEEAARQTTNTENRYGETIRRISKNTSVDTNKLKNIFSALGTAESSAFIDKAGDLAQAGGSEIAKSEREKNEIIGNIERSERDLDDRANTELKRLIADKNAKVKAVLDNVNASEEQRAIALEEINVNLENAIAGLAQDMQNKKIELALLRQNALDTRQNIMLQGNIDGQLLDKQAGYDRAAMNIMPSASDLAADINELGKPASSMQKAASQARLKELYPDLAQIIDGVATGRASVDALQQAINMKGQSQIGPTY